MKRSNLVTFIKALNTQSHADGIGPEALQVDTNRCMRHATMLAFACAVAAGDGATGGDIYAACKEAAGIELEPASVAMLDALRALARGEDVFAPAPAAAPPAPPPPAPPAAPPFNPETSGWGT